jgi:diguanylate cyclase (GGDEF)-like protein/PAS domain S-box-containing protein
VFECAFRHSAVGMALVDLDGRWVEVNEALCRILGYSHAELMAMDSRAITHRDDLDEDLACVSSLLSGTRDSYDLEKRCVHKDGRLVWVLLTASLVRNPDRTPLFFAAQMMDITGRKHAEFQAEPFFEASPDLLAIVGTSGTLETDNAAWERALGWTKEELTARPFLEFVHPEDRAATIAESVAIHTGTQARGFRNRYRAKDGQYHWLEWNTHRPEGAGQRLYCAVRDVTCREQEEQARRWLASLVNSSEDAVIGIDTEGAVVSWNAGAELLFGYTADEMRASSLDILVPPEERENPEAEDSRSRGGSGAIEVDTVRRRKNGSRVDVHVITARVDDDLGQALGWSVTIRDITDRKQLIDALATQVAELRGTKLLLDATFANIQDGVALLDAERCVMFANGAYADMFGFGPEQLAGLTREAFVERVATLVEDPRAFVVALMDPAEEPASLSAEFLFCLPRRRILRRTVKPIDMGNKCLHLVVWHDVTAEKDLIAEREREAMTDALTGIASRRAATAALAQELARAERSGVNFSVALFDIDQFKRVNDVHGHLVGDEVLRRVAGVLAAQVRKTDLVARWGGEEFMAILPANLEGADVFCERVRAAVAELRSPGMGRVTLSAGVTEWKVGEDLNALVGRADDLLYAAKRLGRNRVVSAAPAADTGTASV